MTNFKLVAIFSGLVAAACILIFPLWLLGVPGVQNEYARGWNMGLTVIWLYPLSISLIYGSNLVIRILSFYDNFNTPNLIRWQQGSTGLAIVILIIAIFQMARAFRIILGE